MKGTSVTVVLIGTETSQRKYVKYEIEHSWTKRNGILGVYIHNMKDTDGKTEPKGADPFVIRGDKNIRTYDWVNDAGYLNLGKWIESAYGRALKRTVELIKKSWPTDNVHNWHCRDCNIKHTCYRNIRWISKRICS